MECDARVSLGVRSTLEDTGVFSDLPLSQVASPHRAAQGRQEKDTTLPSRSLAHQGRVCE
jgi:hypothetical protein